MMSFSVLDIYRRFYLFVLIIKEDGSSETSLLAADLSKRLHGVTYHMQIAPHVHQFDEIEPHELALFSSLPFALPKY